VLSDKIAKEIVTRSAAKRSAPNDFGEAATGTTSKRKGKPLHPEENIDDNWEDEAQPPNKGVRNHGGASTSIPTGNSRCVPLLFVQLDRWTFTFASRVQRLTRSQALAASSRNEEPGSSSSHAIPTGNTHQNEVNDVPDDADTIQEIIDSTGLIPYRENNEEALPCAFTLVCIGSMLTYWQLMAKIKTM
jgi:hypothetical protein